MNELTEAEGALEAMKSAAAVARLRASRFGSNLAVWRDGAVALISPLAMDAEEAGARQPASRPESKAGGGAINLNLKWKGALGKAAGLSASRISNYEQVCYTNSLASDWIPSSRSCLLCNDHCSTGIVTAPLYRSNIHPVVKYFI